MELPHVGKQCSVPDCKQLDFLPLECTCKLLFCREHFAQHAVNCPERKNDKKIEEIKSPTTTSYVCSKPGCNEKSIVPLICEKCNRHYCITHRHVTQCEEIDPKVLQEAIERCNAPKKQFQEAKAAVDKEIESNLSKAKRKEKNTETANKVQLMRLKAKATGLKNIPTDDRVYFTIYNNTFCPAGKAVFVARDWTVGRNVDAIATECKIPNNNNKPNAPKLTLFRFNDNTRITYDMSDKLDTLLCNKLIVNGDSLKLEYETN